MNTMIGGDLVNGSDSNNSDKNESESKRTEKSSHKHIDEMQTKRLEVWLTFCSKAFFPVLLFAVFLLFNTEVKMIFGRLTSANVAGQQFSFSDSLKEPVLKIASIKEIAKTIDIRKDKLELDAFFQVPRKYVVLRTSEIPKDKNAQAKQMFQIMEVIRVSIISGEFIGLIVLDNKDRYIGSFDRDFFLETVIPWQNLADYPAGKSPSDIASWVKSKSVFGLSLEYPEARIDAGEGFHLSVKESESAAEALNTLLSSGKGFVAVVDSSGRFQGTVTRKDLLDRLLKTLVPKTPPA